MELLQLEYFYAVAQNQHMTRTAEQLHIAQPSLTQSIRRLEKELGVPLFYRSGRNIALTTYGEALQNALTPVLKTLHQIPTQLQQMALEREKTIRLNVLAASTLVTQALISYKKDHDGLHFRLIQNSQCEVTPAKNLDDVTPQWTWHIENEKGEFVSLKDNGDVSLEDVDVEELPYADVTNTEVAMDTQKNPNPYFVTKPISTNVLNRKIVNFK